MTPMTQESVKSGQLATSLENVKRCFVGSCKETSTFFPSVRYIASPAKYIKYSGTYKRIKMFPCHCLEDETFFKWDAFQSEAMGKVAIFHCLYGTVVLFVWKESFFFISFLNSIGDFCFSQVELGWYIRHSTGTAIRGYFSAKLNWSDQSVNVIEHYLSLHKQPQSAAL